MNGCKIDYNFLNHPSIRNKEKKSLENMFVKSMEPLEVIINNQRLKKLITHPVLSSYIILKSLIFNFYFKINFFMFFILFAMPFFALIFLVFLIIHKLVDSDAFYTEGLASLLYLYCLLSLYCYWP